MAPKIYATATFTSEYKSNIMELSSKYNVQLVVVLQILHRSEPSRPVQHYVDPQWFNPRVDSANGTLRELFKDSDRAILWNHKGFWDQVF